MAFICGMALTDNAGIDAQTGIAEIIAALADLGPGATGSAVQVTNPEGETTTAYPDGLDWKKFGQTLSSPKPTIAPE